jgi:N-acetylmuramoyl-L-alanine amidase
MQIVISSGHGKFVAGASGPQPWGLVEVDEARRAVEHIADYLEDLGVNVITIHDDVSKSQEANLTWLTNQHNLHTDTDLNISCHLNAYQMTETKKMGCEVCYLSQQKLAAEVSAAMAKALELPDRGGKYRPELYWLNQTNAPSILLELVFCDAKPDCDAWRARFDQVCQAIAETVSGENITEAIGETVPTEPQDEILFSTRGKASWFGGPEDTGVAPDEGLAFLYNVDDAPHLFLPEQPPGSTGLARRLNPQLFYVACRWDYEQTPKTMLADPQRQALVSNPANGRYFRAWPSDWGPHEEKTGGRVADLSPALLEALGLATDVGEVEVIYPAGDDV